MHGQHQALLLLGDCKRSEHPFLSTVDDHAVHLDAAQIGGSRTTRLVSSDESDGWSRGRIHGRLASWPVSAVQPAGTWSDSDGGRRELSERSGAPPLGAASSRSAPLTSKDVLCVHAGDGYAPGSLDPPGPGPIIAAPRTLAQSSAAATMPVPVPRPAGRASRALISGNAPSARLTASYFDVASTVHRPASSPPCQARR